MNGRRFGGEKGERLKGVLCGKKPIDEERAGVEWRST